MTLLRTLAVTALLALALPTVAVPGPGPGPEGAGPQSEEAGPRPGPRGPRADGPRDPQRFMAMLERRDPARHAKVVALQAERPHVIRTLIVPAARGLRGRDVASWARFTGVVDAAFDLHTQLTAYAEAKPKQQQAMRAEIEATVGRLFDLRQAARRDQLAQLEARLAKLRAEIDSREANKESLVDTFTEEMLRKVGEPGF